MSLSGDEGVKRCTIAFRACSFMIQSIKMIKNDRKIQDMGQKIYLFTFHMIKITGRVLFYLQK